MSSKIPQLHVHVVARTVDDAAWPGPVWNADPSNPSDGQRLPPAYHN